MTTQITFCTLPNRSRKKICSVCHTFVFDITGVRKHNTQNIMKETTAETVVNFAKFSMRTELIIMVYHSKFTTVLQEAVWQEIDENWWVTLKLKQLLLNWRAMSARNGKMQSWFHRKWNHEPSNQFLVQFYPQHKNIVVGKFLLPYLGEEINNFNTNNVIFVNNHFQILIGY